MIPLHQTSAALAAAILVVDSRIGGVLLKGSSGSGKSELLSETERYIHSTRIPLCADTEALVGGIDLTAILSTGEIVQKKGLLGTNPESILVMEHLDLFKDDIQDIILDSGRPILGTISSAGEIKGRLLDKFGLCADLNTLTDPEERLSVLVSHFMTTKTDDMMKAAVESRGRISQMIIPRWFIKACAFTCSALRVRSHRGEFALFRSALALASLLGDSKVGRHHLNLTAPLALGHRSCGHTGNFPDLADISKSVDYAVNMARRGEKSVATERMQDLTDSIISQVFTSIRNTESTSSGFGILSKEEKPGILGGLSSAMRNKFFKEVRKFSSGLGAAGSGRTQKSTRMVNDPLGGRPVRAVPTINFKEMNPLLSVKAAARAGQKFPYIPMKKEYLRKWEKYSKPRVVCMLAVDGSRSSQEYLRDLGVMLDGLFNRVFDLSSRVGLSVIKNSRSVVLFPPIRNRLRVFGRISELQPQGSSPLDELLSLSAAELRRISKSKAEKSFIILVSDCYPEPVPVGNIWNSDIYERVRRQAVHLGRQGVPVLVVDPVQTNPKHVENTPGRKLGRFIAHSTGGNLISFGKPSEFDIFGALKDDHSKPRFIAPPETGTVINSNLGTMNSSLGSLFDQMTAL